MLLVPAQKQHLTLTSRQTWARSNLRSKLADCECLQDCKNCKAMKQSVSISWNSQHHINKKQQFI